MPDDLRSRVRTKTVATLGPASDDLDTQRTLCNEGVDVFRLNFSHGTLEGHAATLERLRRAIEESGRRAAILGDLRGPKIRLDPIPGGIMEVATGDRLTIGKHSLNGSEGRVSTTYDDLVDEVDVGHRVLIDDGNLGFEVVEKRPDELVCRCTAGGILRTAKGVNLPDSTLNVGSLTDYDRECVAWAATHRLDYLALSF
ncbi:MAG: pyruvate kinase, partial [Acidobacteriota bacterium]|nr:pyruvate kinase [Acidobacteriota bacterium]